MSGGELRIVPADVRSFAQDQLGSAGGFIAAPPPPPPGDDEDDPTKAATSQFTDSVQQARTTLKQRSDRHAEGMTAAASALESQDQQNAANVAAVAPKDQMSMMTGAAKDLLGVGTGAFKDLSGVFTSTLQSFAAMGGSALTAAASAGSSAAGAAAGAMGKAHPSEPTAAGMAGGAPISEDEKKRGAATQPASASSALTPSTTGSGAHSSGGATSYVRPQDHQHDDVVRPAGFAMPGGAGLAGAHSGAPLTAASRTFRIKTGEDSSVEEDETPTGPIEIPKVLLPPAIASI